MEGLGLAANQVQMASTVRLVKLAFKAPPACLVLLEPRATWEIVDLPVSLANPG
jgi:peptide deformylase